MSASSDSLSSLARSKLSLSTSRDVSLHKWVLLKNSILHSPSLPNNPAVPTPQPELHSAYRIEDSEEEDEEVLSGSIVASGTFMFPDTGHFTDGADSYYYADSETRSSEAQWLDSLLETLGDDEDDDFPVDSAGSPPDHHTYEDSDSISSLPVDDDEFALYSPMGSPMSSSDDLPSQPSYYSSPISVPYPVPYPPLVHAYCHPFHPSLVSSLSASPYEDPLPYQDVDDLEEPPVPDAIEDTSDDESDAPTTPSLGRSSSSLSFDPASIASPSTPSPPERSRLRHSTPRVYVDSKDTYFYSFEVDPLPFREHLNTSYNSYSGC